MSLPARPWEPRRIQALYHRSKELTARALRPYNWRLMKRADRIAERSFALWFQANEIDPHAPAVGPDGKPADGRGTRRPRR